jgi:cytoskeletal protein CcmA (bactofilin family)
VNAHQDGNMAKDKTPLGGAPAHDGVISIIGAGMRVVGSCDTEGTLRIEGELEGTVRAGKAVVVGKDGVVIGDIDTQDAIIGGKVKGTVVAESRLELQATCVIDGEVHARRIKLDEGGRVNGEIRTGEVQRRPAAGIPAGPAGVPDMLRPDMPGAPTPPS